MQALREDICELERRRDSYEPHTAVLDDPVREVLPDVNMLGPLASSNDVVAPLDARGVVLEHLGGVLLSEAESLEGGFRDTGRPRLLPMPSSTPPLQ